MKAGVVRFPGSNCDRDCFHVLKGVMGVGTHFIWHKDGNINDFDLIVLPGGFSYGDYLRCGAIAKFSPVMQSVVDFAERGGLVVGICNGFQILTEAGLLPGVLTDNKSLRLVCKYVNLKVSNNSTAFTSAYSKDQVIKLPVAHAEGNYFVDDETLAQMEKDNQVVFRYCGPEGEVNEAANFNGSMGNAAGIVNKRGNVLGMMPHPERSAEALMRSTDGYNLFASIKNVFEGR